jgi:uncharacterized protein (TIGR03067 family)
MRNLRLSLFVACGLVATAWAWDDATKKDLEALQGEWRASEVTSEGQKTSDTEARMFRIGVKGDVLTLGAGGEDRKARFKIDPAKTPKEIDLTWLDGPGKGSTIPGIYAIEKGRWKLCVPNPRKEEAGDRPKTFTAAAGEGRMLFLLEPAKSGR